MSELRIPYRSRDDSLADIADAARALPAGEDRAVVRGLVLEAAESGMTTAGHVLDAVERMTPDARRRLLDRARNRADLPKAADDARKVRAPMISDTPVRDESGRALQTCAAERCGQYPLAPSGATIPVKARKWWCPAHQHLASPGDLEPWTPRMAYGPSGAIVFLDELERDVEIATREAERRAAWLEDRRAARIAEWPALEAEHQADVRLWTGDNLKPPKTGVQP